MHDGRLYDEWGTVNKGFKSVTGLLNFSKNIETQNPLAKGCLY